MKNNRRKKTAAVIEFAVILLLFAALAVMFAQYCILKNTASVSTATTKNHSFLQAKDNNEDKLSASSGILSPEFVGIVSDGKRLTPVSHSARQQLMADIDPFLVSVFSDISTEMEFSSDVAKDEYVKSTLSSYDSYIYLTFTKDLPAGCFVPALGGYCLDNIFHSFNVKELYIFCSNTGELSGLAIDSDGNLTSLSVRDRSNLSFESLKPYEDAADMCRFDYAVHGGKIFPLLTSSVSFANIASYTDSEDFTINNDDEISKLLDSFGFNPNSTSSYRTANHVTFVEQTGELSISSNADISYSSSGNGIGVPLSEFSLENKDAYSFEEKIIAACNIIEKLDKNHFGGSADLTLYSASYNEGLLTLEFSYTFAGVLIDSAKSCATLVIDNNSLISAQIDSRRFMRLDSSFTDIPQKLLFAFSSENFDEDSAIPIGFSPVYAENDGVLTARFALIFKDIDDAAEKEEVR